MTSEKQDAIRSVLKHSHEPQSTPQIRKEILKRYPVAPKELTALLESMVAAGEVFPWPRKKFWDRDPRKTTPRLILEFLDTSPVAAVGAIKRALKLPLEFIQTALEALVNDGRVHPWQPGATVYYCLFEPDAAAKEAMAEALADGPLDQKELLARLRNRLPGYQARHLKELVPKSGQVVEHPRIGKRKVRYGLNPPAPGPYLDKAVREVLDAHKLLSPCRVSLEAILEALEVRLGLKEKKARVPERRGEGESPEAEGLVLEGMARLQPFGQKRALVSIRELRRSLNLPRGDFDGAVLALARKNRVALHHHDFPAGLTPSQQEELVRDEGGTYYVGIVLKEAS
jgi:hypothetical protein